MQEQIIYKKVSELKNNPNNPRKNDTAVDTVAKSIEKYGFRNPLIIDDAGMYKGEKITQQERHNKKSA